MQFNEMLSKLRKSRGYTQEQLAGKLMVSRQAIARWESGETAPDVYILKELSEIFGVSADNLLNGIDESPQPIAVISAPEPKENPPAGHIRHNLIFAAAVVTIAAVAVTVNVGIIKFSGMKSPKTENIYSQTEAAAPRLTSLSNARKTEFWTAEEYEDWAGEQLEIYREKYKSGEEILWYTAGGKTQRALTEEDLKNIEKSLSETLSAIKNGDLFTKDESIFWTDGSGETYCITFGEVYETAAQDEITVAENYSALTSDDFVTFGSAEEISSASGTTENGGSTYDEIFAKYTKYGLEYVETDGTRRLFYNGKSVKKFIDEAPDGGVFTFTPDDPGDLTVRVEYDEKGNVSGVSGEG